MLLSLENCAIGHAEKNRIVADGIVFIKYSKGTLFKNEKIQNRVVVVLDMHAMTLVLVGNLCLCV